MKISEKAAIGAKIFSARITNQAKPFFVQYSLLNDCNAVCVYCNSPHRGEPQIDTAAHRQILSEFAALGALRIKLLGGEPLLRSDIGELVGIVQELGMRCAMVTNGFMIERKLDVIKTLDELIISIDGGQEAHDRHRGAGTWDRVMGAIEICSREKMDFFLSAVVTNSNEDQIDWLLGLADKLGVMVNFQIPQFNPDVYGSGAKSWMPDAEDVRRIIGKVIQAKRDGAPVLFSARSYQLTLDWDDFSRERDDRPGQVSPCTAGRYFVNMEPNGDIYPCVLHIGTFSPKNALADGVEAAWRHAHNHSCFGCYNTWLNENRAIFDLNPAVLSNFWANYMKPRVKTRP